MLQILFQEARLSFHFLRHLEQQRYRISEGLSKFFFGLCFFTEFHFYILFLNINFRAAQRCGGLHRYQVSPGWFFLESACSPRVCVGSLRVLRLPPTTQKHAVRLTGDSKLFLGVSVNGCVAL